MRGKGFRHLSIRYNQGITPAHAGKSFRRWRKKETARDHPRTCGEKQGQFRSLCASMGSPPHMRGKVDQLLQTNSRSGITPAHAGKRITQKTQTRTHWDHPRTCGEKYIFPIIPVAFGGSPPHMRGKGGTAVGRTDSNGITPAHAGKRERMNRKWKTARDHPRTCGEKAPCPHVKKEPQGSPPHMRGKVHQRRLREKRRRITPAHAGKRSCPPPGLCRRRAHPRTCGEKLAADVAEINNLGSPPHMRGKEAGQGRQAAQHGITPAHAGKRGLRCPWERSPRDHPRTCGEKGGIDSIMII